MSRPSARRPCWHCAVAAALATLACAGTARSQVLQDAFWAPNGPVEAAILSGNTLYLGGGFSYVGPQTGGSALVSATDGTPVTGFPRVLGSVLAAAPDGSGGWYVGGAFASVGGFPRSSLAHILADRSVSPWNPGVAGFIRTLAVSGSTVYVGGQFTSAGGQSRTNLAAIDATTGAATSWDPEATGGVVNGIALSGDAQTLYAAGTFTGLGGQPRNYLGAVSASTGLATAWDPEPNSQVLAIAVDGSTVYAGGTFGSIGGLTRVDVAALDAGTGLATAWNPGADDAVWVVTVHGSTVYLGGLFRNVGGVSHPGIAAVTTGGVVTSWAPMGAGSNSQVFTIGFGGSTVYLGGEFGNVGGQPRNLAAAIDSSTGATTAWNPNPNQIVRVVAPNGSNVFMGGDFTSVGGQSRSNLVAVNAMTGVPTAWNPAASAPVTTMLLSGGTLYVGGDFTPGLGGLPTIGGQPRYFLAALDTLTGNATAWSPRPDGPVGAMALSGSTLYVSGTFASVSGQARQGLAAVDATTGAVGGFAPAADGSAAVLAAVGGTVYVGGTFTHVGGQARNHFAALDGATGLATAWDPGLVGDVSAVLPKGGILYVGGTFTAVGGQPRNNLAALDTSTALATAWDPGTDGPVTTITLDSRWAYVGGTFANAGGLARFGLAALDTSTGAAQPDWHPSLAGGTTNVLLVSSPTVYAGGAFLTADGELQSNLAVFGDVSTPALISILSVQSATNDVRLTWYSASGAASATVYRRTTDGVWEALGTILAAGDGRMVFDDDRPAPGARYEYRLGVASPLGEQFYGEVWVDVPLRARLALAGARPNPARRELSVTFSLASASPASLDLVDVSGRRIAHIAVGALGPGSHTLDLAAGRPLVPGLYFLRLEQGGSALTTRAVFAR